MLDDDNIIIIIITKWEKTYKYSVEFTQTSRKPIESRDLVAAVTQNELRMVWDYNIVMRTLCLSIRFTIIIRVWMKQE